MKNKIAGLCKGLFFIMGALGVSGCSWESSITSKSTGLSSLSACSEDQILSGQCAADAGQIVTSMLGSNITSWSNAGSGTTVSASIPDGYYQSKLCSFEDLDLTPANIANGVNVFGVLGTASGPYAACTDDALNAAQCSTAASRYVYTAAYGGRNATCSAGLNAAACWTNAINQYTTSTAGANVNGVDGSLSATIPSGYYAGTETATMSDTDLAVGNIRSGVNLFGTTGTFTGTFALNMGSTQHRDKTTTQVSVHAESTTNAATAYTNSGAGYRAVPDINKDDEGYSGTSHTAVNRTGWSTTTCGTAQATIDLRIADCAAVFTTDATWDGATKGNAGQGTWRLVTRTGDITSAKGREVWRDERTKLLWSSKVGTAMNWCRASGSNFITNNPTAQDDPSNYCDNAIYQNTGTGPATKAVSACFEDGVNYFTTSHASIDNAGKAGLNLSSTPVVAWRLPTIHDYHIAEANGIRFVMPDMLANGAVEWSSSVVSDFRSDAWLFYSDYGLVNYNGRNFTEAARCVGR